MANFAFIDSQNLNLGIRSQGWGGMYEKDQKQRSVETLGISGHGDNSNVVKRTSEVESVRAKKTRFGGRNQSLGLSGHRNDSSIIAKKPNKVNQPTLKKRNKS